MKNAILHVPKESTLQRTYGFTIPKLSILVLAALLALVPVVWGQEIEWIHQFGTLYPDLGYAWTVDTDASGNVYVAGMARGVFPGETSAGDEDAFVCKYDVNGNKVWLRQFGTPSRDNIHGISVDATGVYVAGSTAGAFPGQANAGDEDVFVRKYDTNGNEVWTRQFGTSGFDIAYAISVDATGIYVGGLAWGALPGQINFGSYDAFVRKYDANGNEVWTRQFGWPHGDSVYSISVDAAGIYVAGYADRAFVRKYDANGNEIWTRLFGTYNNMARGISVDATGIYVVVDAVYEVFVLKYDVNGNQVWTRQFGTSRLTRGYDISTDATGIYIAGFTEGTLPGQTNTGWVDAFVRKYDENGTEVWTHQFGSLSDGSAEEAYSISVNATGVYVVGQTTDVLPGQSFAGVNFIRKYNTNGVENWTRQFGSLGPASDAARAVDTDGNIYVVGDAGGPLPGQANAEKGGGFVRKYDANGNEVWTRQIGASFMAISVDVTGVYVGGQIAEALPGQTNFGSNDALVRKYDANGNELWTRQFGTSEFDRVHAISVDVTGVYLAGNTGGVLPGQTSAGDVDSFVRKYDANGNELWTRQFGTSFTEATRSIAVDATGVYVAGTTEGVFPGQTGGLGYDDTPFVRKYDTNGNELWTRQFGAPPWEHTTAMIAVDATGVYLAGETGGALPGQTNAGKWDAFVRKYDPDGNEVWTRQFGTAEFDLAYAISVDATGVYVAGGTNGAFPGQTNAGGDDIFVRKYDANGNEVWTFQFGTALDEKAAGIAGDATSVYVVGYTDGAFGSPSFPGRINRDAFVAKIRYNHPPIANAGTDQTVIVNETVQLDGSGSSDPDGNPLTYTWEITSKPAGSNATLSPSIVNPTFVADVAGECRVSLVVNDGTVNSAPDEVIITVITAQDAVRNLINQVLALNKPQGNGLANGILKQVVTSLGKNDIAGAIDKLQLFIKDVNKFIEIGKFSREEGQPLIDAANAIIAALRAGGALPKNTSLDFLDHTSNTLPAEFRLEQNSPNPFNPVTTIQFAVPRQSHVRLKVYNAFGAEVATLVDQQFTAGTHKINWDAGRLASGFYLYRLEAEGFAQTKKLLLMK